MSRYYVSGPMSGIPGYNFHAFDAATAALDFLGHEVVSPAEHDREVYPAIESTPEFAVGAPPVGFTYESVLGWDFKQIIDCDGIVMLPGWEASRGARAEKFVAEMTGKRVLHLVTVGAGIGLPWIEGAELRLVETPKPIIVGLSGYAQTGKDTAALALGALTFERLAFADALRTSLYNLNPSIKVKSHWTKLRTHVDLVGWEAAKKLDGVRSLLQRMGTEAVRNTIDDNAWVNVVRHRIEHAYDGMAEVTEPARFVVTDVRFPNEAKLIKELGGEVWRIKRDGYAPVNAHVSETALDDWPFDQHVRNVGDMQDYTNKVAFIALRRGLLNEAHTARLNEFFEAEDTALAESAS
jgi:hypothetical protein